MLLIYFKMNYAHKQVEISVSPMYNESMHVFWEGMPSLPHKKKKKKVICQNVNVSDSIYNWEKS